MSEAQIIDLQEERKKRGLRERIVSSDVFQDIVLNASVFGAFLFLVWLMGWLKMG